MNVLEISAEANETRFAYSAEELQIYWIFFSRSFEFGLRPYRAHTPLPLEMCNHFVWNIQSVYWFCSCFCFHLISHVRRVMSAFDIYVSWMRFLVRRRERCKRGDSKNGTFKLCSNIPSLLALMVAVCMCGGSIVSTTMSKIEETKRNTTEKKKKLCRNRRQFLPSNS